MIFKVGDEIIGAEPGKPLMVILSDFDKLNLKAMFETHPEGTKYAVFADNDTRTKDEMFQWMETVK